MRNSSGQFIKGHKRPGKWSDIQKMVMIGNKYGLGVRHTKEEIEKIRNSSLKRWANPEYKKRLSEKFKGHLVSRETRKKISEANKGRKFSEEHKNKLSEARRGKKHTEEWKERARQRMLKNPIKYWLGRKMSEEHRRKVSESHRGEKSYSWQGGITNKSAKIRNGINMRLWREAVFARDNYTCQECGKVGGELNAHHIKGFAKYPELRFAIDNGRTLCEGCHKLTDNYLKNYEISKT